MNRKQKGVTLIEILVSVVIFSVGLLGLAGMQLNSIRFNESASVRGHAVFLASEMADRMRARPDGVDLDKFSLEECAPKPPATSCEDPEVADLADWLQNVRAQLPSGGGSVDIEGNRVTITVNWSEERLQDGASQTISIVTRM